MECNDGEKIECVVINSHADPTELDDIATKFTVKSLKKKCKKINSSRM